MLDNGSGVFILNISVFHLCVDVKGLVVDWASALGGALSVLGLLRLLRLRGLILVLRLLVESLIVTGLIVVIVVIGLLALFWLEGRLLLV